MKKILIIVALCALLTLSLCSCSYIERGSLWWDSFDIVGKLDEDGSMHVTETWVYAFSDDEGYRNVYRTVSVPDSTNVISNLTVYDNDNDMAMEYVNVGSSSYLDLTDSGTCYLIKEGLKYEFGVVMRRV